MPRQIQDPIFGELTFAFDPFWEGVISVPGIGEEVHLSIEAPESGPEAHQREAFQTYLEKQGAITPRLEPAIAAYYRSVVDIYRQAIGPDYADELAPKLTKSSDVWGLLSFPGVFIPRQNPGEKRIILTWECTWDVEHGFQVEIEGDEIVEAGLQV